MGWPVMLWTLVSRMRPTLPSIGQRGHARLTVLRLSVNQLCKWEHSCGGLV